MSQRKSSSGDKSKDPNPTPRHERTKNPYQIIRYGHIGNQVYQTVIIKHIETGEVIYNQSL